MLETLPVPFIFMFWLFIIGFVLVVTWLPIRGVFVNLTLYHVVKHKISHNVIEAFVEQLGKNPMLFLFTMDAQILSEAKAKKRHPDFAIIVIESILIILMAVAGSIWLVISLYDGTLLNIILSSLWVFLILSGYITAVFYPRTILTMEKQARIERRANREEGRSPVSYLPPLEVKPAPEGILVRLLSKPFQVDLSLTVEECVQTLEAMADFRNSLKTHYRVYMDKDVYPLPFRMEQYSENAYLMGEIYGDPNLLTTIRGCLYLNVTNFLLTPVFTVIAIAFLMSLFQVMLRFDSIYYALLIPILLWCIIYPFFNRNYLLKTLTEQLQSAERQKQQPDNRG
jgi:hypothetical protein